MGTVQVQPRSVSVSPQNAEVAVGDTITFMFTTDMGDMCDGRWLFNNQLDNIVIGPTCTLTATADMVGSNFYRVIYYGNGDLQAYVYFDVVDSSTPEPSPEPSPDPSPDPSGDWVTIPDMNTSQSNQTSEIKSHIDVKSNLLLAAIESLERSLSNSDIYELFTQSFIYYDFDFQTGDLAVSGNTYNGFVPTFNHWAQNVERYLGMLVDVRASEDEEEVKNNTGGFWSLLNGLFKPAEGQSQAAANTDDMSTILGIGDDVQGYFNAGGNIGDIATVINDESTWAWFGDDVSSEIDSVPSTYSRERIVDYRSIVYNDFYNNVLDREWSDVD